MLNHQSIQTMDLDCGATLLVEENPSVGSASLSWWLPTGTMHDLPIDRAAGCSILCASVLERGAGGLGSRAFNDALDRLGVIRSVSVYASSTQVNASFREEVVESALPRIIDLVRRPAFPEDGFEAVRNLCLQSIEGLVDDPVTLAGNHIRQLALPSPFHRHSYGDAESIREVSLDDARAAWRSRARPGGSIIAAAGAVDASRLADLLNSGLEGWTGAPPESSPWSEPLGGDRHVQQDTAQVHLEMALPAPQPATDEELPFLVATRILGGGASSRLFESVRERQGLCYDVHAIYSRSHIRSLCMIGAGTTHERVEQTVSSIYEELDRLESDGVTGDEFDRVRMGLKTRLMMHGESTAARAQALAQDHQQRGRARTMSEVAGDIERLTHPAVDELVRRAMNASWREDAVRVSVGPRSPFTGS